MAEDEWWTDEEILAYLAEHGQGPSTVEGVRKWRYKHKIKAVTETRSPAEDVIEAAERATGRGRWGPRPKAKGKN